LSLNPRSWQQAGAPTNKAEHGGSRHSERANCEPMEAMQGSMEKNQLDQGQSTADSGAA